MMNFDMTAFEAAFGAGDVPRRPDGSLDPDRMIAEGKASIARIEAARQARWERHAGSRERALRVYEEANRRRAAELDGRDDDLLVAASAWWEPVPLRIW